MYSTYFTLAPLYMYVVYSSNNAPVAHSVHNNNNNNNHFHGIEPCSKHFWDDYYPGLTQKSIRCFMKQLQTAHMSSTSRENLSGDLAGNRTHNLLIIMRPTLYHCTTRAPIGHTVPISSVGHTLLVYRVRTSATTIVNKIVGAKVFFSDKNITEVN
jgi:hypothetical protein